ncbi:MAG: hypothetical protein OXG74_00765 [Acidobacteria bacterium]|nr:hypothetical protein [Acidobacteriota bacterium]
MNEPQRPWTDLAPLANPRPGVLTEARCIPAEALIETDRDRLAVLLAYRRQHCKTEDAA